MRRRIPKWAWGMVAVLVIVGAPIAWYLGSPLFINRVVDEPFPGGVPAASADPMPPGTAQGAVLARGTFAGADDFHKGQGTATLYRVGGEVVLRLDPFRVTNGPDLRVILTRHASPRTRADVMAGYLEVARLKANIGSQNYTLPAETNLADYRAVVIYCKPFHVVFAVAPLAP
ncbi:MAG: DM13 domain-containing protein [Armatimonadota bacterium]|nr:DM13 domain-containing protein [Armatimonadota bacterium]